MAQGIYDELLAAGAPALPDDYFYRVRPMSLFSEYVNVQVRRRILGPFSYQVGSLAARRRDGETEAEAIAWSARHAYDQAFGEMPFERFLGDHP